MSPEHLLRVLLAALGVYFIGHALPSTIFGATAVSGVLSAPDFDATMVWIGLVSPIIEIVFGACILVFRESFARRLESTSAMTTTSLSESSLHIVGLSIIGAFFLVRGSADLGGVVALSGVYGVVPTLDAQLASAIAQALLGLLVFLGAPGMVGLWRALRSRGSGPRDAA